MIAADRRDVGIKIIVAYKLVKAGAGLLLGLALLFASAGIIEELSDVAEWFRDHGAAAWSVELADRLVLVATKRNLLVVACASLLDSVLSFVEGWALHRRYSWSRWLIVGASSCLIPFEVAALIHRVTAGRMALLFVNALIVVYLITRRSGTRRQGRE